MRKIVVKTGGDSLGIRFNTQERKIYNIEENDIVDLSDMQVIKQADENISNIMAKQKQPETIKKIKEMVKHG